MADRSVFKTIWKHSVISARRDEEGTTRLSYTPAYRQAVDYLKKEMEAAGLRTWEDGVGNCLWRIEGNR